MSAILPQGEALRKAVQWIAEQRREKEGAELQQLVHEAMLRFNLTPKEGEFLIRFYSESSQ